MKENMILIAGKSGTGKTTSLRNLRNHEGVGYFNCEGGKALPFRNKFKQMVITDPKQVPLAILKAEDMPNIHTLVIDSVSFMMDMYINTYVYNSENPQKEWGTFAQWMQTLMLDTVAKSTKNLLFITHTVEEKNEDRVIEVKATVPGKKLAQQGFEAFFNNVVVTKKMTLDDLTNWKNDLLTINEREKRRNYKYCFQTESDGDTVKERIRNNLDMWKDDEVYIDNDIQLVIDRIQEYNQAV